jgi:hypothetical protein
MMDELDAAGDGGSDKAVSVSFFFKGMCIDFIEEEAKTASQYNIKRLPDTNATYDLQHNPHRPNDKDSPYTVFSQEL